MRKCRDHPLLESAIYVPFAGIVSEWLVPEIILGVNPSKRSAPNDQICRPPTNLKGDTGREDIHYN